MPEWMGFRMTLKKCHEVYPVLLYVSGNAIEFISSLLLQ